MSVENEKPFGQNGSSEFIYRGIPRSFVKLATDVYRAHVVNVDDSRAYPLHAVIRDPFDLSLLLQQFSFLIVQIDLLFFPNGLKCYTYIRLFVYPFYF